MAKYYLPFSKYKMNLIKIIATNLVFLSLLPAESVTGALEPADPPTCVRKDTPVGSLPAWPLQFSPQL